MCLALVKTTGSMEVLGHSRIAFLPRVDRAVWIESVVVRFDLRGKGYGRVLMNKTEEYARQLGFTSAYLSTHDQQGFYYKLGYEFCAPVSVFGAVNNKSFLPKDFILPGEKNINQNFINSVEQSKDSINTVYQNGQIDDGVRNLNLSATPPRDIPPLIPHSSDSSTLQPSPPPPPPPPPPSSKIPVPPMLPVSKPKSRLTKEDIEMIPASQNSKMYMKKDL